MPIEIKYTPALEPGTYEATVTDVQERVNKDGNPYRWWEFTTEAGRTISAISSMNVGPRSKAGGWIAALLGRTPVQGESVEMVGQPCIIAVTVNDDGFSEISSVVGRPKTARGTKPLTASQEAPGADASVASAHHAAQEGDELPF